MLFDFEDRYGLFDVTPVDNQFIQEYLPLARGDDVRVYLYGLMQCYHPEADLTLAQMSRDLGLTEETVERAYQYWERKGLVRRVSDHPPVYQYVSLRQRMISGGGTQLDPDYEAFVDSVYGVFDHGRRLHGGEIRTCYEWVEDLKLPPEAVIMLLKHMERNHGKNFSIKSAQQIAMQMAMEGVGTVEEAEAFLSRDEGIYQGTRAVLKRLGKRNLPSEDQLAMYRKWVTDWGFTPEAVLESCAETAKGDPSMGYLDGVLKNTRERAKAGKTIEAGEVRRAREESEGLRKTLKALRSGSVREESLDWYRKIRAEFSEPMLMLAARECGRSEGSLDDVEKLLRSWQQKNITSPEEAEAYIRRFRAQGDLMKELRKLWGLSSLTGTKNREMLASWEEMGFSPELILTAAESAVGTDRPMYYLDTVLRSYAARNIRTKEEMLREREAHRAKSAGAGGKKVSAQQYVQRDYSEPEETIDDVMDRLNAGKGTKGNAE